MFVRWTTTKRGDLKATLVRSVRKDGKVKQEVVKYLGTYCPYSYCVNFPGGKREGDNRRFVWGVARSRLSHDNVALPGSQRKVIERQIAKRVPCWTAEDQAPYGLEFKVWWKCMPVYESLRLARLLGQKLTQDYWKESLSKSGFSERHMARLIRLGFAESDEEDYARVVKNTRVFNEAVEEFLVAMHGPNWQEVTAILRQADEARNREPRSVQEV